MRRSGDYEDEMGRLSAEHVETVLSGRAPEDPAAVRAAVAVAEVRITLSEEPPPRVAARHLAAMFEAARQARPAEEPRRARPSLPARSRRVAAMVLAATMVLGVGIGAALTLPDELAQTEDRSRRASAPATKDVGGGTEGAGSVVPTEDATPARGDEAVSGRGRVISDTAHQVTVDGCSRTLSDLPPQAADQAAAVAPASGPCAQEATSPGGVINPATSDTAPGLTGLQGRAGGPVTDGEVPGRQDSAGGSAGDPGPETPVPGAGGDGEPGPGDPGVPPEPGADNLPRVPPEELLPA